MSGIRAQPGAKDRVWMSAQEKQAAAVAAADKRPDYDNQKLLKLLRMAKSELAGLRLVHLHLSLLKDRDASHQTLVRSIVNEMASKASFFQAFALSNGDVICLYKGLKLSAVTEVCLRIEQIFLSKSSMISLNPYKDNTLYSIMELSLNFVSVMRFIEELHYGDSDSVQSETKPPITLEEMSRLEKGMPGFDLSPFLFNQPVVDIGARHNNDDQYEYFELYISIRHVQERLCPNYDLTANKWLFNYFTSSLDYSMLRALSHGLSFMRGRRIALNMNLSTVFSSNFVKFDETLPIDYRSNVVLEIGKGDLIENHRLFNEVAEFASDKKYRICLDALTPFWVTNLDIESLNCDYAKIFWSPDMLDMDDESRDAFADRIQAQRRCQFIMARCDTVSSIIFAQQSGIRLVQGRAVDNILRKGVTVYEAIGAAHEIRRD